MSRFSEKRIYPYDLFFSEHFDKKQYLHHYLLTENANLVERPQTLTVEGIQAINPVVIRPIVWCHKVYTGCLTNPCTVQQHRESQVDRVLLPGGVKLCAINNFCSSLPLTR